MPESLDNLNKDLPVSKLGKVLLFGLGIKKEPNKEPDSEEIKRTLLIVAWAPLDWPVRSIPEATHP